MTVKTVVSNLRIPLKSLTIPPTPPCFKIELCRHSLHDHFSHSSPIDHRSSNIEHQTGCESAACLLTFTIPDLLFALNPRIALCALLPKSLSLVLSPQRPHHHPALAGFVASWQSILYRPRQPCQHVAIFAFFAFAAPTQSYCCRSPKPLNGERIACQFVSTIALGFVTQYSCHFALCASLAITYRPSR